MKSITSKMVLSYLLVVFLVVLILGGVFMMLIWNYYYGSASSAMKQRVQSSMVLHSRQMQWMGPNERANYMLQSMKEGDSRIQMLQADGRMFMDSDGLSDNRTIHTPDVVRATAGETTAWTGDDDVTGERIVAASSPLYRDGRIVAIVRYSASLQEVDAMVARLFQLTVITGLGVALLFLLLSVWLANRIARPLRELTRRASRMA